MKDLGEVSGGDFIPLFASHELYKMGTPSHQPLYILAHSESKFHGGLKESGHQKPGHRFLFKT